MKRLISILVACALMFAASGAQAEANWWSDIGPTEDAQAGPTQSPALTWEDLFDGWMPDGTQEQDDAHSDDVLPDDGADEYGDEGEDVPPYDDIVEEGDDLAEEDDPNALFDPQVRDITGKPFGNAVQCAMLNNDWVVARGYFLDNYRVTAEHIYGYDRQVMADAVLMFSFVPAGDGIIYYGEATKGPMSWLYKYPGDAAPYALPLKNTDSVFYADSEYIWYFSYGSGSTYPISRIGYDGKNKKQLGKLKGTIIGMMDDGSVLAVNYSKNQVLLWKDGKSTVVYEPKKEISRVYTTGRAIWVQHEREFGLLEDGRLSFSFPGVIRSDGCSSDQMVFVVQSSAGAARFDVLMFNEAYRAWARVGDTKAQVNLNVELSPSNWIAVWGPEESQWHMTPAQGEWLPYGYHDRESAENVTWQNTRPQVDEQDEERVTRRVAAENLQMTEKEVMADAKSRGITVTRDRDGLYSYLEMTADQHGQLLYDRSWEILGNLGALKGMETISGYDASEDLSLITLYIDGVMYKNTSRSVVGSLDRLALLASAYQSFLYETEYPAVVIQLSDQATGETLETLHAPSSFLPG